MRVGAAFAVRPILTAWLLAVGLDLFFNAGVFMPLFDQDVEPSLLPDAVLFRRIPVAYLALMVGVSALGWLIDSVGVTGTWSGMALGATTGAVLAMMGVVYLWTAIEMTGGFVAAGSLVGIVQFTAAGGVLGAFRDAAAPSRLTRRTLAIAAILGIAGLVIQNLQG